VLKMVKIVGWLTLCQPGCLPCLMPEISYLTVPQVDWPKWGERVGPGGTVARAESCQVTRSPVGVGIRDAILVFVFIIIRGTLDPYCISIF
jgi:hypothetical protein